MCKLFLVVLVVLKLQLCATEASPDQSGIRILRGIIDNETIQYLDCEVTSHSETTVAWNQVDNRVCNNTVTVNTRAFTAVENPSLTLKRLTFIRYQQPIVGKFTCSASNNVTEFNQSIIVIDPAIKNYLSPNIFVHTEEDLGTVSLSSHEQLRAGFEIIYKKNRQSLLAGIHNKRKIATQFRGPSQVHLISPDGSYCAAQDRKEIIPPQFSISFDNLCSSTEYILMVDASLVDCKGHEISHMLSQTTFTTTSGKICAGTILAAVFLALILIGTAAVFGRYKFKKRQASRAQNFEFNQHLSESTLNIVPLSESNNRLSVFGSSTDVIEVPPTNRDRTYISATDGRTYIPVQNGRIFVGSAEGPDPSSLNNNERFRASQPVINSILPGYGNKLPSPSPARDNNQGTSQQTQPGSHGGKSWAYFDTPPVTSALKTSGYVAANSARRDSDYAIPYSAIDSETSPGMFALPKYMQDRPNSVFFRKKPSLQSSDRPRSSITPAASDAQPATSHFREPSELTAPNNAQLGTSPSTTQERKTSGSMETTSPPPLPKKSAPLTSIRSQSKLLLDGSGYAAAFYETRSTTSRVRDLEIVNRPRSAFLPDGSDYAAAFSPIDEEVTEEGFGHPRTRTADDLAIPVPSSGDRKLSPRSRYLTMKKLEQGHSSSSTPERQQPILRTKNFRTPQKGSRITSWVF